MMEVAAEYLPDDDDVVVMVKILHSWRRPLLLTMIIMTKRSKYCAAGDLFRSVLSTTKRRQMFERTQPLDESREPRQVTQRK